MNALFRVVAVGPGGYREIGQPRPRDEALRIFNAVLANRRSAVDWIRPVPPEQHNEHEREVGATYYALTEFGRAAIERGRRS